MNIKIVLLTLSVSIFQMAAAQSQQDTLKKISLEQVTVTGDRSTVERLPAIQDPFIWAGKKNEVIATTIWVVEQFGLAISP